MKETLKYLERKKPYNPKMIYYVSALENIKEVNPELSRSIVKELIDQKINLKLIASENYSSINVQSAMGNLFTDKYAEGFPEHRFYAGCDNVDDIEKIACERACKLFGCDHAFVQPHSGADANLIAYWAVLYARIIKPLLDEAGKKNVNELNDDMFNIIRGLCHEQRLMGMDYSCGGHLTHGYRQNISAHIFNVVSYGVDNNGLLDYNDIEDKAMEYKPLILLAGYSAYPRKIDFKRMREIADKCGAVLMVDMAHFAGLVAGKQFTGVYNPIPYADIVTTTTHKTLRGPRGGMVLCKEWLAEAVDKACPLVMGGPIPQNILAKAVALEEAMSPEFEKYAEDIMDNAHYLASYLQSYGVRVLTGGTDNHMLLIDVTPLGINGMQAEYALRQCGITCNRNALPNDVNGPWFTSGIRIGVPAVTTLGMGEEQMEEIADIITNVLNHVKPFILKSGNVSKKKVSIDSHIKDFCKNRVKKLLDEFALYPEIDVDFLRREFYN